jgi:protein SCO1
VGRRARNFWFGFLLLAALNLGSGALLAVVQSATASAKAPSPMLGDNSAQELGAGGGVLNSKQVPAKLRGVGIVQRLNNQVPMGLMFRDASGKPVQLGDLFDNKPVILSLVYFTCPMLCTMEENSLLQVLRHEKFTVGDQFNVITVSFDPHDTPEMAANKRQIYLGLYGRRDVVKGWHFLTGDETSIRALTDAVGFHYHYDPTSHEFAHAVGIVVLTPGGRVSKYFYGLVYSRRDVRLALIQASNGRIGSPVDALILYCCEYDPATGKYGVIIQRVLMLSGIATVIGIGALIVGLSLSGRQRHAAV